MKSIHADSDSPEFSCFNPWNVSKAGQVLKMKSRIMYLL